MADLDALAKSLAATARDLEAHIERRANEIALRGIALVAEDRERRIGELQHELAMSEQRREDVIAEFHRILRVRDRDAERQGTRIADLAAAVERVRAVRCWENEDHKWFAFRDDLFAALNGEVDPS